MSTDEKQAINKIINQIYLINSRNISMRWIGMKKTPTKQEISELNAMLGFIIKEMRVLRETGKLDVDAVHKEVFHK